HPSTGLIVHWQGTDGESGLEDYSVFVSENGSPSLGWRMHTAATSDTFPATDGNTYAFYSTARDRAGNEEMPPSQPDATIAYLLGAETGPRNLMLECARGNPARGGD